MTSHPIVKNHAGTWWHAPVGISYELFLDANGEKISKSKGNGLTIDEWLRYGSPESLSLFMYNQPKRAKRLHFDVIPKTVDEYYQHRTKIADQDRATQMENPVWHIHSGIPEATALPVTFTLLLNLAAVSGGGTVRCLGICQ